ncbi:hypothetical protein [Chryseobacterium indoltheticum]|uniref:hypothetical protein n=1 Tax=Chryseobacterium indoltheticum TaxID=254 RepID=UPI003F497C35
MAELDCFNCMLQNILKKYKLSFVKPGHIFVEDITVKERKKHLMADKADQFQSTTPGKCHGDKVRHDYQSMDGNLA